MDPAKRRANLVVMIAAIVAMSIVAVVAGYFFLTRSGAMVGVPSYLGYTFSRVGNPVQQPDKSWKVTVLAVRQGWQVYEKVTNIRAQVLRPYPHFDTWKATLVSPRLPVVADLERFEMEFIVEPMPDLDDKLIDIDVDARYSGWFSSGITGGNSAVMLK